MSETVRCPCKQCHFVPATRTDSEVWVCDTPGGGWRLGNNVYCPKCGRHLKPGGEVGPSLTADLAALREDAARVARVRDELDLMQAQYETRTDGKASGRHSRRAGGARVTAPPLADQLAALDVFTRQLPASMRDLVRERYLMGYEQYGDTWATGRDNLAEALPEIADALVYVFQAVMAGQVRLLDIGQTRNALSDTWMHYTALQRAAAKRQEATR